MERGNLIRWLLIGAAVFLFLQYGLPQLTGKGGGGGTSELQPIGYPDDAAPKERKAEETCSVTGVRFTAELTSQGAALKHARMGDEKYAADKDGKRQPIDLVTTWKQPRLPLRTNLRGPGADQMAYDDVDWQIAERTKTSCTFKYEDAGVALEKVVAAGERPFELTVKLQVTNKAAEAKKHRLTIEQTDSRKEKELAGSWGRLSEFLTEVVAQGTDGKTKRLTPDDFEPSDFKDEDFTPEKWRRLPAGAKWVAVSSSYFSKAVVPVKGPSKPSAEMRIEEWWTRSRYADKKQDPDFNYVYRARLNYGLAELKPGASASYEMLAYVGPKERDVLGGIGGASAGDLGTTDLLDLGVFGSIGKLLISYLYLLYGLVGTWGVAICLMTITVKVLLFPLSISQIKSSMGMRKLKPQMDELNAKYKDDPQQKGLALQELFKKNKVANPVLGCLPVMLQMPVWFALYTALQTAVELYHTPFGPFIPDLSAPDKFYIIPIVLGLSSFLQQRLMPMQGDAMQQKMMMYLMPAVFTVMMLFLPAGLGIYFLTNTWLGIGQQVLVERYYQAREGDEPAGEPADAGKKKTRTTSGRSPTGTPGAAADSRG